MRGVVQRVSYVKVMVGNRLVAKIGRGILVFLALQSGDTETDGSYMVRKICGLRIFPSSDGSKESDRSVVEVEGEVCLVPQFTLMGDVRKGNRPSYSGAEEPALALKLFQMVAKSLEEAGVRVVTGSFQDHMHVELQNDGPFTILLDSKKIF